jgi:hypothetical protein
MVAAQSGTVRRARLALAIFGFRSRPVIWRKIQKDVRNAGAAVAVAHPEQGVRPQPRSFVIPFVAFVLPSLFTGAQIALRMRRARRDCALFSNSERRVAW